MTAPATTTARTASARPPRAPTSSSPPEGPPRYLRRVRALLAIALTGATLAAPKPAIVSKPVPFSAARRAETAAYAQRHYGLHTWRLTKPHVIVEHYTS